jgi:hypothetical protein
VKQPIRLGILTAAALAVAIGTAPARAALISTDLAAGGDGLLILDQGTSLEWLDLTETTGLSPNAVTAGLGAETLTTNAGASLLGFRYATQSEIETLWTHADPAWNGVDGQIAAHFDAAFDIIGLMGCTTTASTCPTLDLDPFEEIGHLGIYPSGSVFNVSAVTIEGRDTGDLGRFAIQQITNMDRADSSPSRGHYLIRDAVITPLPEPTPGALMALALAVFGLMRLRRGASPNHA